MKIKSDFVTNSSSTSFILINKRSEDWIKSLGHKKSNLGFIFEELYQAIESNKCEITEYINNTNSGSIENFLKNGHYFNYSDEVINEVKRNIELGNKVYVGLLSSDSSDVESFFCCESFIISNENIYLNAESDSW